MKFKSATIVLLAAAIMTIPTMAMSQTNQPPVNNFVLVTNLWYNGYKSNVLAIAEQRLAANSNDLAGLVLTMEFNLAFSNESCLSNDISKVIQGMENLTNGTFHSRREMIANALTDFLDYLANEPLTPEELEEDRAKASIIHKPMTYERYLKWLHDDGLF